MTYKADTPVKVYNHSVSPINLPGQFRAYYLDGTHGTVQFSEAEREDVYRALYLDNWRDTVLFDEEIDRIIRENDMDAAEKFLKLTTVAEIHRVRGHMVALANDDNLDISKRMIDLIDQRYDEINHGVRNTKVNLGKTKERAMQDEDPRISVMMEQMAALQAQLAAMQTASQTATAPAPKKQTTRKKAAPVTKIDAE